MELDIGGDPGPLDDLFEVTGVAPLGAGRWVIGQEGEPHLLLVEGGEVTERLAREGDGPGEFRTLHRLVEREGGGAVVYDSRRRILAELDPALEVLSERSIPWAEEGVDGISLAGSLLVGSLSDTELLVQGMIPWTDLESLPPGYTVQRMSEALLSLDDSGALQVLVPEHPGEDVIMRDTGGWLIGSRPTFGKRASYRVAGGRIFSLDTGSGSVVEWDREGERVAELVLPPRSLVPTDAEIEAAVAHQVDSANAGGGPVLPTLADNLRRYAAPGPVPVLRDFIVSRSGVIWLWFDPVGVPEGADVVVRVEPADRRVERFRGPVRFVPFGGDDERVWGIQRDESDVEHFLVLRAGG